MPLEVRELVIKVTVSTDSGKPATALPDEKALRQWKESIIRECMDKILSRMKTEADR
ncbi:DUF5908 family protein [Chitinophaga filiformis]|uniref:DUF5908 family protein n=1 Tax=Chitinophaga filiformis TaxID=104663 RepID=UPI001F350C1F|nr:DUF5908 family protein [Chitinophaga filiformis]MCF6405967.1 DUF5908 family protein [Chitinophaga filiformis]